MKACTDEAYKVYGIEVMLVDEFEAGTDSSTSMSLSIGKRSCNTGILNTDANDWYRGYSQIWLIRDGNDCNHIKMKSDAIVKSINVEFLTGDDDIKIDWVTVEFRHPTWLSSSVIYKASTVGWTSDSGEGNRKLTTAFLQNPGKFQSKTCNILQKIQFKKDFNH